MKDLFTAPDEVMCYLCSNYNLHDIPLGNDWTEKNAAKVIENIFFCKWIIIIIIIIFMTAVYFFPL